MLDEPQETPQRHRSRRAGAARADSRRSTGAPNTQMRHLAFGGADYLLVDVRSADFVAAGRPSQEARLDASWDKTRK